MLQKKVTNYKKITFSYVLYFILSIIIFILAVNDEHIISIIISPLLCLIYLRIFFKDINSLFDFRTIYLLSIFTWSFAKSISIIQDYDFYYVNVKFLDSILYYIIALIITPNFVFIFKCDTYSIITIDAKNDNDFMLISKTLLLTTFIYMIHYASRLMDEPLNFIFKQLSQGLVLVISGAAIIMLCQKITILRSIVVLIVSLGLILLLSMDGNSRTFLLLPVTLITLSILINNKIKKPNLLFKLFILSALFISILTSDLMKKNDVQLTEIITNNTEYTLSINELIYESNFLPEKYSALNYFESINAIIVNEDLIPMGLLYQFMSIITPRQIFIEKEVVDLSKKMWDRGRVPQPLYYEIFLEPIIDSGIFGVFFYFIILLLFIKISEYLIKSQKGFKFYYFRSVYILNLITMFYVIRGPAIFLAWYALIPNLIIWALLIHDRAFIKNR